MLTYQPQNRKNFKELLKNFFNENLMFDKDEEISILQKVIF